MLRKLNSAFEQATQSSDHKHQIKPKDPFFEAWKDGNFRQTKELIIKLLADIDAKINHAIDENDKESIRQNRIYEANLRKLAEYINPIAEMAQAFEEALKFIVKAASLTEKFEELEDFAPVLVGRIKANQSLYSDADLKIPDDDLAPLLREGKLLPFYEKFFDLMKFVLNTAPNAFLRFIDESDVAIDEQTYLKNAEELFRHFLELDKFLSAKGADLSIFLEAFDFVPREKWAEIPSRLPAVIHELDPTSEDARKVSIFLDGSFNMLIKKLIEMLKEYREYAMLTEPLFKSTKESKDEQEPVLAVVTEKVPKKKTGAQTTASLLQHMFGDEEKAAPTFRAEASPKAKLRSASLGDSVVSITEEAEVKHFVSRGRMFIRVPVPTSPAKPTGLVDGFKKSFSNLQRRLSW